MSGEPAVQEWEHIIASDLASHLTLAGPAARPHQPLDVIDLPAGARAALTEAIGCHGLDDVLVVPAAARSFGRLHRHCVYTPPCVLGVGERAAGLWVQALPVPGVRAIVPLGELAAVELRADGTESRLTLRSHPCELSVRYNRSADPLSGGLLRLRHRAAGEPAPLPGAPPGNSCVPPRWQSVLGAPVLGLRAGDAVAAVFGHARRPGGREYLIALTASELVVIRAARKQNPPHFDRADSVQVPRRNITEASIRDGCLMLRSAGVDLRVELGANPTPAASVWLEDALNFTNRAGVDY
jgi:hypothetical protein